MGWTFQPDRPIYSQLMEQIKRRIITGEYPPGEKMPSVRELAMEAAVNPNTMQKAFAQLEQEGLLHTQRTSGRFVTEDRERIMSIKEDLARNLAMDFLRSMQELGYSDSQTVTVLEAARLQAEKDTASGKEGV
jgi:GntR family transcriptional regulator